MAVGDPLGDGEAQTRARGVPARVLRSVEALEDVSYRLGGHTPALVLHAGRDARLVLREREAYGRLFGRVLCRVLHDDAQRLLDEDGVGHKQKARVLRLGGVLGPRAQLVAMVCIDHLRLLRNLRHERCHVARLPVELVSPRVPSG